MRRQGSLELNESTTEFIADGISFWFSSDMSSPPYSEDAESIPVVRISVSTVKQREFADSLLNVVIWLTKEYHLRGSTL